ncbi:unnamed protein product [Lathyrus sativus]|nr:unnamed protein product [Lathyrus sativus]
MRKLEDVPAKVWESIKRLGVEGNEDDEVFQGIIRKIETSDRVVAIVKKKGIADVCFLQETKCKSMKDVMVKSFWGDEDCLWSVSDSSGQSGGILTIWRAVFLTPLFSFRGSGFLGLSVIWRGKKCLFLNVYSSCVLSEKCKMWAEILDLKSKFFFGEWVVGGDFNSTKCKEEKRGKGGHSRLEIEEFKSFIELLGCDDLPIKGNSFTWFNGSGSCCSRLDRLLISPGLISE